MPYVHEIADGSTKLEILTELHWFARNVSLLAYAHKARFSIR